MSEAMTIALRQPTAMMPLSAGSLDAYIAHVNQAPVLDVETERKLAHELRDEENLGAAQKLVMSNLRHVVHIARGYLGYGLPLGDLIQEGNIGLMKAVKRFDPEVGVRLISFAVHWIKAEIHEFILKNWRIVKIATTKAQRKLFFNLRSQKKSLGWLSPTEAEAIAADLKVKPEEVFQMEARLSGHDMSFDSSPSDDEESSYRPEDWLASDVDDVRDIEEAEWQDARETRMQHALTSLDPRSRDILQRRWLNEDGKTGLQELADEYGVSAERIRQIEVAAMKKLRKAIEVEDPAEA
ncbi:RNA polymerase sigma factor RpoH [Solimonas marina]|uniref:RNA polymerase sigma factor RpoH n=1 Tax=Solimonas marina TaxID=2714601 RepID=A0A969W7U1_9GAMM|nr:RNA polymerase sigma factor RpoH [Solimonas marina]NKF22217.1 RNA polymerase sigma factor RpoH [Solimonas marina]